MIKGGADSSRRHEVTNELADRAEINDVAYPGVENIAVASNKSTREALGNRELSAS